MQNEKGGYTMAWKYQQSTGKIFHEGKYKGWGYSGVCTEGKPRPDREHVKDEGPIPRGLWKIRPPVSHIDTGPIVMPLSPLFHDAHGRTGFQIHGDNEDHIGKSSTGCIVLNRDIRKMIAESNDHILEVVI